MTFVLGAILTEFTLHTVHLVKHKPGMMHQCASDSRHLHAPPIMKQQRRTQAALNGADALA